MPILGTAELFPHTYIAPVIDKSVITPPRQAGYIMGAGYIPYGNPLKTIELTEANTKTFKELSTRVADGGNEANETIYHINHFFNVYSGGILFTRLLGVDSTTKIFKIVGNAGTLEANQATTVDVYGSVGSITEYRNTLGTDVFEMVLVGCPTGNYVVSVSNESDFITLVVQDAEGNEIINVTGSATKGSLDDNGQPNYIGDLVNTDVAIIKASTTATGYVSDWDAIVTTVTSPTVDAGTISLTQVRTQFDFSAQIADYAVSMGLSDVEIIDELWGACKGAGYRPLIVDLKGADYDAAKTFRDSLALATDNPEVQAKAWCFYNEGTGVYNKRRQNIGISGWYAGKLVSRNLGNKAGEIENRVPYTITGTNHRCPIVSPDGYTIYSKTEKNQITKDRINYVEIINGQAYVSDFLTTNPKETYLKQIGIVDGLGFLELWIAFKLESRKGENLNKAQSDVDNEMQSQLKNIIGQQYCQDGTDFVYQITQYNNEGLKVDFEYYPTGHARINKVQGTVKRAL